MARRDRPSRLRYLLPLLVALGWTTAAAAGPLEVFVAIAPQAHLVERVGGDRVHARVLLPPGQDPHTFEPLPRQVMALAKAKLFFKVGLPFEERLLEQIGRQQRQLRIVDTAEGVQRRMTEDRCTAGRDHAQHGEALASPDPHIWLSPPLLKIQAENIARALVQVDPTHEKDYRKNLAALAADIDATDSRIKRLLEPYKGKTFYVFHPAFGYFADAYGLKQEAVEVEGKAPTPKQLRALVKKARAEHVHVLFEQPRFDRRSAEAIAQAIGGELVFVDPLARDPLKNVEDLAIKLNREFGP